MFLVSDREKWFFIILHIVCDQCSGEKEAHKYYFEIFFGFFFVENKQFVFFVS